MERLITLCAWHPNDPLSGLQDEWVLPVSNHCHGTQQCPFKNHFSQQKHVGSTSSVLMVILCSVSCLLCVRVMLSESRPDFSLKARISSSSAKSSLTWLWTNIKQYFKSHHVKTMDSVNFYKYQTIFKISLCLNTGFCQLLWLVIKKCSCDLHYAFKVLQERKTNNTSFCIVNQPFSL